MSNQQQYASMAIEDFKESSGLFDNVNAVITGIQLTTTPPDNYAVEGSPIFANVSFLIDGEGDPDERAVSQGYSLGGAAGVNYDVSTNGYGLVPKTPEASLRKDSKWGTFMAALANEGFPKPALQAGDLSALIGLHGTWKRIADKERSFANARQSNVRKFPPSTLVCIKILDLPGAKNVAPAVTATVGPQSTAPGAEGDFDLDATTFAYLSEVLAKSGGKVQRSKLVLLVSQVAMKDPNRKAIALRASEEAFLNAMTDAGVIKYDGTAKPQIVVAA